MSYAIDFRDFAFDGKNVYASARTFNSLLKIDFEKNIANYVTAFENTTQLTELHGAVIDTDEKIFFIPSLGYTMDIYDKHTGNITSVCIYPQDMLWHCLSAYLVGNTIVMLPYQAQDIICFNIKTNNIKTISNWQDNNQQKFKSEGFFFCGCGTVRGESIYAVSQRNEGILELNVNSMSIIWHHLSFEGIAFSSMVDDGYSLWISANNDNAFFCWNIEKNEEKLLKDFYCNYNFNKDLGIPFCNLIDCGNRILAVAIRANMSLWIDKKTGKITECEILSQNKVERADANDAEEYRLAKKLNCDTILLVSCKDRAIIKYNWNKNTIERNYINMTDDIEAVIFKISEEISAKTKTSFIVNEEIISLDTYLDYINLQSKKQDVVQEKNTNANQNNEMIGNKIFTYIKGSLAR